MSKPSRGFSHSHQTNAGIRLVYTDLYLQNMDDDKIKLKALLLQGVTE
jgi:hypothetical protein